MQSDDTLPPDALPQASNSAQTPRASMPPLVAGSAAAAVPDGEAASLLLAASALSQASTQSVSSALLDKAHMAAAEGRLWQSRRGSAEDGVQGIQESIATSFSGRSGVAVEAGTQQLLPHAPQPRLGSQMRNQPSTSAFQHAYPHHQLRTCRREDSPFDPRPRQRRRSADVRLSAPESHLENMSADRHFDFETERQAHLEIGKIAASAAAQEYVEQSFTTAQGVFPGSSQVTRQWNDANPLQGVPSTPMMPTASLAMIPPPDVVMGIRTPFASQDSENHSGATGMSFQPSYRLAPQEYHILASAAAVATAALTMASTSLGLPASSKNTTEAFESNTSVPEGASRSLTPAEQSEIAATLRAWAGLEGSVRQEEARLHLEELQNTASQATLSAGATSFDAMLSEGAPTTGMRFFPPDFARHYQAQLMALAAGYYSRLHADGLEKIALPIAGASSLSSDSKTQSQWKGSDDFASARNAAIDPASQVEEIGAALQAANGSIDPSQLLSQTNTNQNLALASPSTRDQLLQYAHQLYSTGSKTVPVDDDQEYNEDKGNAKHVDAKQEGQKTKTELHPQLLPLLHTLHNINPRHLPTLLLLSCAYYSAGDLAASLWYNKLILSIDANYVESMSNIGTTLRALGRWNEAESWWWRAIKLRPGYWDAYENLLGVLCSPQQIPANDVDKEAAERIIERGELPESPRASHRKPEQLTPRFQEALNLCQFVESNVLSKRQAPGERRHRKVPSSSSSSLMMNSTPTPMPMHLPVAQYGRLQNLYYAKGNLKYVIGGMGSVPAAQEYEHAVEIMLSPSEENVYSTRDLIAAVYVCGLLSLGVSLPGAYASNAAEEVARAIGIDVTNAEQVKLASGGQFQALCPGGGLLRLVRQAGDVLVRTLLRLGGGTHLPMLMLIPKAAEQLVKVIFAETEGSLPSLVEGARRANASVKTIEQTFQQASNMTSTVLLTLAKLIQDATSTALTGPHGPLTLGGVPPSLSLMLPMYYLSLSLNPAASTANNLGILLSSIPVSAPVIGQKGERQHVNGQQLAMQYYTYGLQLDPKHPHLYTNLGSLCKDLNHLQEAISMYEKAISCNPSFDVALANLGNAIKDQGRTQDSIQYYRRAVEINPRFPEALCGLVNALLAICDWSDVYANDDDGGAGLMREVVALLERQLDDGGCYGAGALSAGRSPEDWSDLIVKAYGDMDPAFRNRWTRKIQSLVDMGPSLREHKINEGSFIIRLIEKLTRESQRRWYYDHYGRISSSDNKLPAISPQAADTSKYSRVSLPAVMGTPSVPTVLPFHTFTLKISPRQIRLISHRTALRITQTTLAQQWVPAHVYPPPAPPAPRIKIGYVSSDFNNHPLAHLMQSCFGFHDGSKFEVFLYATTTSDNSPYRNKIEREAEHFIDVSAWTNQTIISRILADGIHILMNLNGYTKGARNEIFAARPCPVQMEFMGFAGGLASGWTDWVVVDPIVCPPQVTSSERWRILQSTSGSEDRPTDFAGDLDPESQSEEWEYTEKFIYMPDTYFVNDHRQGFREPEQRKALDGSVVRPHEMSDDHAWLEEQQNRWQARKELWPALPDDYVIFCDFNQLYKIEPTNYRLWLRILARVPKSILWLLRFPAAGEGNLLRYAKEHFGDEVAARVVFTDVAPKGIHIQRGRIADLFLDTLECGAHTTSADILWSGTPVLTWPKYKHKMASRVAASIVAATGCGERMIVSSEQEYEDRAVALATEISYSYVGQNGEHLDSQTPIGAKSVVTAESLRFKSTSASAASHAGHSQPQVKGTGGASAVPCSSEATPAPANVKEAAVDSAMDKQNSKEGEVSSAARADDVLPERAGIRLASSTHCAPEGSVSRRAHGELALLRRQLFLTRDANRLFDTRRWMRNLERGYEEAWQRWILGIDSEERQEWRALDSTHPAKASGHIWVQEE